MIRGRDVKDLVDCFDSYTRPWLPVHIEGRTQVTSGLECGERRVHATAQPVLGRAPARPHVDTVGKQGELLGASVGIGAGIEPPLACGDIQCRTSNVIILVFPFTSNSQVADEVFGVS